jgi:hypothetical protein
MRNFLILLIVFVSQIGCKKTIDPSEIPSYIYINNINLLTLSGEGTNKHGITDAWIYVDGKSVGVFELPARIPILNEGNKEIWIYGGIKKDGISSTRTKYPFYQRFISNTINLQRGKIDSLIGIKTPQVTYFSNTTTAINEESFDNPGFNFQADPLSEGVMVFTSSGTNVFEGNGSALMELSSSQFFSKFIFTPSFVLPKLSKEVYVELHYNTNNLLTVGLQAINGSDITNLDNLHLRATNGEWKKVYIDFTELVSSQSQATSFKFYVKIVKEESVSTVYNLIDNFKVVYAK